MNLYRSELRRIPARTVSLENAPEPRTGLSEADSSDRDRAVRAAVQTLPAKYRDALIFFYCRGSDVAVAAKTLGIPEGTVKARLHRGRELLRRKLAATLGETR